MIGPYNSRVTRVYPIFDWLHDNAGTDWPAELLKLAHGADPFSRCGPIVAFHLKREFRASPTKVRLKWMVENIESLVPQDPSRRTDLFRRLPPEVRAVALNAIEEGNQLPAQILEGPSHADCLIECEYAFIWIEGKRFDWLAQGTTWDANRDQIARNLEAVRSLTHSRANTATNKEYILLICHEHEFTRHEKELIQGYRSGKMIGGLPHLKDRERAAFSNRIGTVTWQEIVNRWPQLHELTILNDLGRKKPDLTR